MKHAFAAAWPGDRRPATAPFRSALVALALCHGPLATLRAQEPTRLDDTVAFTTTTLRLRSQPHPTATVLAVLAPGTKVRTYTCADAWCSVHVPISRRSGYVSSEYLSLQPPAGGEPTGRGYVNVNGVWVPSPQRTPEGQPPPGATARCRDGTYSFSQNRRGTCSHHGGVASWLRP